VTTKDIAAKYELTEKQAKVLSLFNKAKKPTQAEAAAALGCSGPNVCQLLKALETKGVLKRGGRQGEVEIVAQ
jgi:DNA-binding MarR family transcriptional regulator